MAEDSITVYHVTEGPYPAVTDFGEEVFQVKTVASHDGGETCGPFYLSFDTEEFANQFKNEVNSKVEPTIIGGEPDE